MSELRENMPEDFEPVKGDTGNKQLDSLFEEIAAEPLLFTKEEAFEIIGAAVVADATSTTINRTVVVGGAILLSAISGWLYYQFSNADTSKELPVKNAVEVNITTNDNVTTLATEGAATFTEANTPKANTVDEQNIVSNKVSSTEIESSDKLANKNEVAEESYSSNSNNRFAESNTYIKASTLKAETNKRKTITLTTKSAKKGTGKLTLAKAPETKTGSMTLMKENGASLLSKTKVSQRFYADGSATVAFEYNKEPAVITINPRGIEQLTINNKSIKSDEYYLYEDIASEAFRRAKIEPLSEPTHDAKVIGDIPGIMTRALVRRNLISADEKFDFVITGANAFLNGRVLDEEQRLDLLQVYQNASGKPLPKEGRFSVKQ